MMNMTNRIDIIDTSPFYIVYKSGNMIKAMNSNTKTVDYLATDAAKVVQNTIDNSSGKIFIKNGTYKIKSHLIVKSPGRVIIQGENKFTTQFICDSLLNNLMIIGDDTNVTDAFTLMNIRIDGTGSPSSQDILTFRNTKFVYIYDTYLVNFNTGILFDTYGGARKSYYAMVERCDIKGIYGTGSNGTGIKFIGIPSNTANFNLVIDSVITTCNIGIHSEYGHSNTVFHSDISYNDIGVKLDQYAHDNKIIGCNFEINKINGIEIISGASRNKILANAFSASNAVSDLGVDTKYWHNHGYKTETNVLSNTFAIDSIGKKLVRIAHGLDIIPLVQDCYLTIVEHTIVDDWGYDLLKVVSTDNTYVTVSIKISTASATVGATAKLALKVGKV